MLNSESLIGEPSLFIYLFQRNRKYLPRETKNKEELDGLHASTTKTKLKMTLT